MNRLKHKAAWAMAVVLVVWGALPAAAQSPESNLNPGKNRPWAQGVSQENQKAAMELFRAGNALLKESVFIKAAEKYRQALEKWDHPAIRYNLALVLMNLDQPVEVYQQLESAMRYGAEPLEAEKLTYARNFKSLLEKQLARLEIVCEQAGATVELNGQKLFTAPGRQEVLLRPGAHGVVATKEGYLPAEERRTLLPGERVKLELKLYTEEQTLRYRTRWPVWVPWLVTGLGVAVAGGSSVLHLQARGSFQAFDEGINACGGCVPEPSLAARRSTGTTFQNIAVGGYAVGGAAVVTGVVLLVLNQPQAYRVDPNAPEAAAVSIAPLLGPGLGGAVATFRF